MKKEIFLIKGLAGQKKLNGEIPVNGAKNAILKTLASSVLFKNEVMYDNVPKIEDVDRMIELLSKLGSKVEKKSDRKLTIDCSNITSTTLDRDISKRMRASVVLTGPILARFGEVKFPYPGGCVLGARPIDIFEEGFVKMGAEISFDGENYFFKAPNGKLRGAEIFFKIQSVTATETFMMAGVLAEGKTVIKNSAMEPEIKDLADFLVKSGAKITGAGTPTIEIEGGGLLNSPVDGYVTMPDRIEAGSFLILGALAANNLKITNCNPSHLESLIESLRSSGVHIETGLDFISIKDNGNVKNSSWKGVNVKTHEYPGFPTDLQAPMVVYLTQVSGESLLFETIFEGRLNYTEDLVRMGADIKIWDAHRAVIKGPTSLKGRELYGPDIRAGLAYVLAGIIAKGESVVNNIYFVDRGYESIEKRLTAIGVDIKRESLTSVA